MMWKRKDEREKGCSTFHQLAKVLHPGVPFGDYSLWVQGKRVSSMEGEKAWQTLHPIFLSNKKEEHSSSAASSFSAREQSQRESASPKNH